MAKINFQQFEFSTDISGKTKKTEDMREGIANHLYRERGGIAYLELAMKVYKSEGATDYSDKEVAMLGDIIGNSTYNCAVLQAFNDIINPQQGKEEA